MRRSAYHGRFACRRTCVCMLAAVLCLAAIMVGPPLPAAPRQQAASRTILTISGTQFCLNGKPTFLLGCSYYGGCGANNTYMEADLRWLRRNGFNWVRVWAGWNAYGNDVSVTDSAGTVREPFMTRLRNLIEFADSLGMVVDVTFHRAGDAQAHWAMVRTVTTALRGYRNVYFDLANERDVRDRRYVSLDEIGRMRDMVKSIDPDRLVTASGAWNDEAELREYIEVAKLDFLAPHLARTPEAPALTEAVTRRFLAQLSSIGHPMPIHYQEPFRRDYNPGRFQPTANDFLTDALAALKAGAAGWCFHNGGNRAVPDGRPRRSFDMRLSEGRLYVQLDDVEHEVVRRLARYLGLR